MRRTALMRMIGAVARANELERALRRGPPLALQRRQYGFWRQRIRQEIAKLHMEAEHLARAVLEEMDGRDPKG
jgi:hypothetical protein